MKLVSLDIETTGLNPKKHDTIEIGAYLFEIGVAAPISKFHAYLSIEDLVWSTFCLKMHKELIERHLAGEVKITENAGGALSLWLIEQGFNTEREKKCTLIGKNVANFDWPFLKKINVFKGFFDHRMLDVAPWYMEKTDERPPGLQKCIDRAVAQGAIWDAKTAYVTHTALDDAWDVMNLTQWHYRDRR